MSNSYTHQSWSQHQPTYGQSGLQLEHEFDFSAIGTSDDTQRQSQQQPAFPADNYHSPPYQLPTSSNPAPPMVRTAFQSHPVSFGVNTNGQTKVESPGFIPVNFGANQPRNQNSGSFDSMYNSQTSPDQHLGWTNTSYNYQNQVPNNNTYPGNGYNDGSHGIAATHLSSSPTPMQDAFPPRLPNPNQQASYYPPATTSDPRAKRAHSQIQEDGRDEEQDADMAADAKEGAKIRP